MRDAEQIISPRKAFKFSSKCATVPAAPIIVVRPLSKSEIDKGGEVESRIPAGSYPIIDMKGAEIIVHRHDLSSDSNSASSQLFLRNNSNCIISV